MSKPQASIQPQRAVSSKKRKPKLSTIQPRQQKKKTPTRLERRQWEALRIQKRLQQVFGLPDVDDDEIHDLKTDGIENETEYSIRTEVRRQRHPISSVGISMLVHLTILIALAFFVFKFPKQNDVIGILAVIVDTPTPDRIEANTQNVIIEAPDNTESPIDNEFEEMSNVEDLAVAETKDISVPSVIEANAAEPSVEKTKPVEINTPSPSLSGGGLKGRESDARANLASKMGGSAASELAVENGLRWVIAHQRRNGSWYLQHDDGRCNGQCQNEGLQESTTAATGLALMALLGAGYTHQHGPYQQEVRAGLDYLISKLRVSSLGGSLREGEKGMYAHAIATIAISEAYILTQDSRLLSVAGQARDYIESAQHKKGGWRYIPGSAGDLSVTGWQIMALKSCDYAGIPSGEVVWLKAEEFINRLGSTSGRYGYQSPDEKDLTMTAVGLLSQMYLGVGKGDPGLSAGVDTIAAHGPESNDIYFNYYATLVMHHIRGEPWEKWNLAMREYLIATQDRSRRHSSGSWHFPDRHGDVGGRLYSTCMAIMTLEVYYRYLPMYQ
ncbi:MAG: prenyltransferase/squalene oxidase repeat-containing protein [Planctomycetota bacterium]